MHSHFSRDGGQYFVAIFQFYPEHSVGHGFQNDTILFNERLFRHRNFRAAKIGGYTRKKKKPRSFFGVMWKNMLDLAQEKNTNRLRPYPGALWSCPGTGSEAHELTAES